jgi:hypothetical protein
MNCGHARAAAIWISLLLALWIIRCVRSVFLGGAINVSYIVSNLLAGIVLVDWLAVAPLIPPWTGILVFLALFGLSNWLQRFVPAT